MVKTAQKVIPSGGPIVPSQALQDIHVDPAEGYLVTVVKIDVF
jgi:hypothetical protein